MITTVLFGAGCFWGVEEAFRCTLGVIKTQVGYAGGDTKNPNYKDVCAGSTGHAEVVKIEYDDTKISFQKLLDIFWKQHNPTRVLPDKKDQYRSVIFYTTAQQQKTALASIQTLTEAKKWGNPITTQVLPMESFFLAEEYHQQYKKKLHAKGL